MAQFRRSGFGTRKSPLPPFIKGGYAGPPFSKGGTGGILHAAPIIGSNAL